jgi:2-methylcitrate dehydratase PrpD
MTQAGDDAALRSAVERELGALCAWAAGLTYAALPRRVLTQAVLILGDNIAAALSAADEPELRAYHEQLQRAHGAPQATLFRAGAPRVPMIDAAVGNGLAATWNELDDGYTRTAVHPGALSQPLILAAAEAGNLPLADTLRATVGAYEIGTRFARAWPGTLPRLHPHGVYNTVCAAAGLALLRGADAAELMRALTAAATLVSPGPYSHPIEGALVRNAWPAAGAWLGAFACDMARLHIAGTPGGPYDVYTRGFGAAARPEELGAGLGTEWTICDGYHKLYGACHHSHAAMEAIESMLAERPDLRGGRTVRAVLVEGSAMAMNFANAAPATTLGAKFSIPHAVAATLAHGAAAPGNFLDASLRDETIIALRRRVSMAQLAEVKPWPLDRPARVTLELEDGSTLTAACEAALGSPARPLDADRVLAKIRELAARDAPGLAPSVVALRQAVDAGGLAPATCREWIAGFFAGA